MEPFTSLRSTVAALDRVNVDTDQIVPKQFLKRIERTGFGACLFHDWRFLSDGSPNPEFELNDPRVVGAKILIANRNFGCGSSREHAPWALLDYGFQVIIAPSFADIFYNNCFQNGILSVVLSQTEVDQLLLRAKNPPLILSVDLPGQRIKDDLGFCGAFEIDAFRKECLLRGLDAIGLTLQHERAITDFENRREAVRG